MECVKGVNFSRWLENPYHLPSGTARRASHKLELVHTDVCGPMRTPSLDNSKYFILFIDNLSRMTWVYFLKERSEVFKTKMKEKTDLLWKWLELCCMKKAFLTSRSCLYGSVSAELPLKQAKLSFH